MENNITLVFREHFMIEKKVWPVCLDLKVLRMEKAVEEKYMPQAETVPGNIVYIQAALDII